MTSTQCRASSSLSRSSRKSQSLSTKKVESKYLGSLKVLDRKVLLKDPQAQGPDSLRAAIYQVSVLMEHCYHLTHLNLVPGDCFTALCGQHTGSPNSYTGISHVLLQDWLQKKNEKSKESTQKRRKEELRREKKKKVTIYEYNDKKNLIFILIKIEGKISTVTTLI